MIARMTGRIIPAVLPSAWPLALRFELLCDATEKLGIGFQILDDVKNLTTGIPGKKRGDDIVEGKKSLPILLFLQRWPEKKEMVCRCFNAAGSGGIEVPEVEELIQELLASNVIAEAREHGRMLIDGTRGVFESPVFFKTAESRSLLGGLINLIS
jgi:octaprenyl-diphosphate synthase